MNNKKISTLLLAVFSLSLNSLSYSAQPAPKADKEAASEKTELANLKALDFPCDKGESGLIVWDIPENEGEKTSYRVFLSSLVFPVEETAAGTITKYNKSWMEGSDGWIKAEEFKAGEKTAKTVDLPFWAWDKDAKIYAVKLELNNIFNMEVKEPLKYYARVEVLRDGKTGRTLPVSGEIRGNWFRLDRLNNLILLLIVVIVFFIAVSHAKRKGLFIRRIAGLDAIDEAIGRATEMGKPIFYVPGIGSMSSISTIASTFILGEVSKKVAQYDSCIKVPHFDPIVMTVSKEIVKQAYIEAERPDSYREDINQFISSDQFSYAATIDGMITREKPDACFFMGYFMAESLLLAEVGASTGAIQIAGTDVEHQLPFFFTACDYTLIGEELYAAGAYLSREPMLLSALKVQDFGKLIVMASVLIFSIGLLIADKFDLTSVTEFFLNLLKVY